MCECLQWFGRLDRSSGTLIVKNTSGYVLNICRCCARFAPPIFNQHRGLPLSLPASPVELINSQHRFVQHGMHIPIDLPRFITVPIIPFSIPVVSPKASFCYINDLEVENA